MFVLTRNDIDKRYQTYGKTLDFMSSAKRVMRVVQADVCIRQSTVKPRVNKSKKQNIVLSFGKTPDPLSKSLSCVMLWSVVADHSQEHAMSFVHRFSKLKVTQLLIG